MFDDIVFPILRDHLRSELSLDNSVIECHIDETVWPSRCERFISIYPAAINIPDVNSEEAEAFKCGFNVGVTVRCGDCPEDRLFPYTYGSKGIVPLVRGVLTVLRRDRWTLQTTINDALAAHGTLFNWKYVEPYRFQGGDLEVIKKGPNHFHAEQINETRLYYGLFASAKYAEGLFMAPLLNAEAVI